ncbi:hypothetical protein [Cellulosimicrobium funkei]|uniref:Integral membrane protein n=1 Tax=Cellulosimicrobium funkei TaxID=264251 RepID=A0A4Y8R375_9MICO|nr:hypothetical protein [Cellulosimicrobium funkei]TFF11350.1 hypothetical protein E1O70_08980 [Cellulosimicrobium funkei]TGA75103.1 hypothetical protein EQW79_005985 [Cellulosimicrobium terreum]
MTTPRTAALPAARARLLRPATWRWWVQVLVVYALARAVSAVVLLVAARSQEQNLWTDAAPSYFAYVARMWDASWYEQIYSSGYPDTLPVGPDGAVQQNVWAFFPLFPALVRALDAVTGLGWEVLAPTLALACGAGAVLVVHRLVATAGAAAVERRPGLPLATVLLVSVFPSSPVLQVAYTESLALLLVAGALLLLARRRYAGVALLVALLGFCRAVALPMAAVVLWHGFVRWRRGDLRGPDAARLGGLLVVALASGLVWPWLCGAVTGVHQAYFRTQEAWRGGAEVVPFVPWVDVSRWLAGDAGPWLLALVLVVAAALVLNPVAARLGPEMHAWSGAYLAYLVATVQPGTSLVRFLLLAFPLGAVTAGWTRSRAWLAAVTVACVVGQVWWVWSLWRLVPPSGWPP